ncbi:hypothetical protein M885DRAFT_146929 [Pelagophyceae sp. CCMP2097]|nr:hypothetical protein M885DRAFT_146929 [Pelagophyceae sp. CCMP2097]|mmetsp:Transcript_2394/g.8671  ORF Transcript_2394/g.8671 Transcript_2394/m.8671 type:complete len:198 (-) Transcript_2394:2-595(-)
MARVMAGLLACALAVAALSSAPAVVKPRVAISEGECARLFGRLADKLLLLDVEGAGTDAVKNCCHGGCDNCDFSQVFDEMRSSRPKWIACYTDRTLIDGRAHQSPAMQLFNNEETLSIEDFVLRLDELPCRPTMGPKSPLLMEAPSEETKRAFFQTISEGNDSVDAQGWANGLQRLTGEDHGAIWLAFRNALVGDSP